MHQIQIEYTALDFKHQRNYNVEYFTECTQIRKDAFRNKKNR